MLIKFGKYTLVHAIHLKLDLIQEYLTFCGYRDISTLNTIQGKHFKRYQYSVIMQRRPRCWDAGLRYGSSRKRLRTARDARAEVDGRAPNTSRIPLDLPVALVLSCRSSCVLLLISATVEIERSSKLIINAFYHSRRFRTKY